MRADDFGGEWVNPRVNSMVAINWQKYSRKIAEKTYEAISKEYPDVTVETIQEAIVSYHLSKPPRHQLDKDLFRTFYLIESAMKKGWIK